MRCGRAGIILLAIFATVFHSTFSTALASATSPASRGIQLRFDLFSKSLDKAFLILRSSALQSFLEPSIVAGLQTPQSPGNSRVTERCAALRVRD